jgi:hypothetical protein
MPPPKLSYGLNLPSKKAQLNGPPSLGKPNLAAGQKRKKTIFDDSDSEDERGGKRNDGDDDGAVEITTLGGLDGPGPQSRRSRSRSRTPPTAGLNKSKDASKIKPPPGGKLDIKASKKSSIFADDDEEEEEEEEGEKNQAVPAGRKKTPQFTGSNKDYTNLAALHSSKKHAKEAEEIDPSIYSYDAVYDSIKAKRDKPAGSTTTTGENGEKGSRYMDALLRSAEARKRDQLRARDRLLAREREAEGDEFADKEKFVTAAYIAQQEEIRRLEEEEARREKEEEERRKRSGATGMVGFYRDILARDEQQHGEAMKAAQEAARKIQAGEVIIDESEAKEEEKEKSEAQIAAELNARGANIVVNDEGQIVDKRQLLSAGLNVAPKPKSKPSISTSATAAAAAAAARRPPTGAAAPSSRNAQRARQTEMIAAQLEERTRQEEEDEAARQRELAERIKTRKTETDVMSARERYLARKREKEAQAKGGG